MNSKVHLLRTAPRRADSALVPRNPQRSQSGGEFSAIHNSGITSGHDRCMGDPRIELESKVAMLEHTVDVLSGELAAHQLRLDRMQATIETLAQQLKRLRGSDPIEPNDSRPPHWGG